MPLFRADNLRESESLRQIAEISGRFLDEILNFGSDDVQDQAAQTRAIALSTLQQSAVVSNLVPGAVFAPDGTNLTTVDAILDPVTLRGDRFTAYQFTPLNETSAAFNVSGTGSRADLPPAVFAPENVVLLTDGTCGSTCTLFSYLMIQQLGIKATVIGGRPRAGPMQSIAGVEGAQIFFLQDIAAAASAALTLQPEANVTGSELALLDEGYALTRAASPANPGAVNGKNAFMRADATTPLQFLYQPANCRFFYTADMLYSPLAVWKRAVDATWTDPARFCVAGSRVTANDTTRLLTDARFFTNTRVGNGGANGGANSGVIGSSAGAVAAPVNGLGALLVGSLAAALTVMWF